MNKKFLIVSGIFILVLAVGYLFNWRQKSTSFLPPIEPTSTSEIIATIFKGTMPCADCPGIEEILTLNDNHTYTDKNTYLEKDTSFTGTGEWQIINGTPDNPDAIVYELTDSNSGNKTFYLLSDNQLKPLDPENLTEIPIPGNRFLTKE